MRVFQRFLAVAVALVCAGAALEAQQETKTYRQGESGVVAPVPVKQAHPKYTAEAREKRVQGLVELEAVVLEDGTVGDVRVTKSLEESLDGAAVDAMKRWIFKPGQRDGKAVRVLIDVEMTFTLK
jgi:periplasmic protein TonB